MRNLAEYFYSDLTASGAVVQVKRTAPDWLRSAILDSYGRDPPSDWIRHVCKMVCEDYDLGRVHGPKDAKVFAQTHLDWYDPDVYFWAADMCLRHEFSFAEKEANELGYEGTPGDALRHVQNVFQRYIAEIMLKAIVEQGLTIKPSSAYGY